MSNACLIRWFEQLLFGSQDPTLPPPPELREFILRLEAEHIPWSHILSQGGFSAFPYQVHGDLNLLLDHLDQERSDQVHFKTRAVTQFWNQLQCLLARRRSGSSGGGDTVTSPSRDDDAILQDLLDPSSSSTPPPSFQSAEFWGQVARRFIPLRRPASPAPAALLPVASQDAQRAVQLYDMTCMARGRRLDPLSLHLVPHAEYVNAAHWQTLPNLQAFLRDRPTHPLSLSVQALRQQTVDQLLEAEAAADLPDDPRLEAFLHNVRVIHQSIEQVASPPPRLIDVFQRLLALCHRDGLWERDIPPASSHSSTLGTSLLYLTEQLRIAEREKRLLWRHAEAAAKPSPRICSDALYASRKRVAVEEQEDGEGARRCPTFPR